MAPRTASPSWARVLTEIFQPPAVLAALLVVLPWGAEPGWRSLAWGLGAAVVGCGVPLATVVALVRRGVLTDHHVSVKEHRRPVMAGTLLVVLGVLAATLAGDGPREITALLVATLLALGLLALVSPWWKISAHAMMMGGTVTLLAVSWGPVGLTFTPVALLVCWSRAVLTAHTWAQVTSGFLYGLVVLGGVYAALAG